MKAFSYIDLDGVVAGIPLLLLELVKCVAILIVNKIIVVVLQEEMPSRLQPVR